MGPGPLAAPFAVALDERLPWRELEPGIPVHREGRGRLVLGALRLDCSAARVVDTSIGAGSDPRALAAALAEAPRPPAAPSLASGSRSRAGDDSPRDCGAETPSASSTARAA
jgi:hypothetical protein